MQNRFSQALTGKTNTPVLVPASPGNTISPVPHQIVAVSSCASEFLGAETSLDSKSEFWGAETSLREWQVKFQVLDLFYFRKQWDYF